MTTSAAVNNPASDSSHGHLTAGGCSTGSVASDPRLATRPFSMPASSLIGATAR
jgi:hypothetical protein